MQVQHDRLRLRTGLDDCGRLAERLPEDVNADGHGEKLRKERFCDLIGCSFIGVTVP